MRVIFVGHNYPNFVKEATKLGVSRNVPFNLLKGLKWGEEVMCAKYAPMMTKDKETGADKKVGKAHLLVTFKFNDIFIGDPNVNQIVLAKLREQGKSLEQNFGGAVPIVRGCGSYSIGGVSYLKCPMEELYEMVKQVCGDFGQTMKPRVMIGGPVVKVWSPGSFLTPVKFTRGMTTLSDDTEIYGEAIDLPQLEESNSRLVQIDDYHQVWSKKEQAANGNQKLLEDGL